MVIDFLMLVIKFPDILFLPSVEKQFDICGDIFFQEDIQLLELKEYFFGLG